MVQAKSTVLKVEVTHSDGNVYTLRGDAAEEWNQWLTDIAVFAAIHGRGDSKPLDWEIIK